MHERIVLNSNLFLWSLKFTPTAPVVNDPNDLRVEPATPWPAGSSERLTWETDELGRNAFGYLVGVQDDHRHG